MHNKKYLRLASLQFLILVLLHLFGVLFNDELAFYTKPLLIISLVIFYMFSVNKLSIWYIIALVFSFLGNVLLLYKDEFFVLGVCTFLIAHIIYIKIASSFLKKVSLKQIVLVSIPYILILFLFLDLIFDYLGELKIPVVIYGVVIAILGTVSLLNYIQQKTTSNLWLFLGASFYIFSDILLSIDKFYVQKDIYDFCIMVTYIIALFLICKFVIAKHKFIK